MNVSLLTMTTGITGLIPADIIIRPELKHPSQFGSKPGSKKYMTRPDGSGHAGHGSLKLLIPTRFKSRIGSINPGRPVFFGAL